MSDAEQTGWRDLEFSLRHREWGLDAPLVDIDFMGIEYDHSRPRGLVEYKSSPIDSPLADPNTRALLNLACGYRENGRSGLPCWMARYWWSSWAIRVIPLNWQAKALFAGRTDFSERDYVMKLYELRGREIPPLVYDGLNRQLPPTGH